jgi:hypothetical protein
VQLVTEPVERQVLVLRASRSGDRGEVRGSGAGEMPRTQAAGRHLDAQQLTRQRARIREHAGHAAYMFSDLKAELGPRLRPISIVHASPESLEDEAADFTLKVLRRESEIVRWWVNSEREGFLRSVSTSLDTADASSSVRAR